MGNDGMRDGERVGFFEGGFDSIRFTDTDELNAHIAFSALSILKDKSAQSSDGEGDNSLYSAFSTLDLMSEGVQSSLQCRPPCRWERHTVNSTIPATGNTTNIANNSTISTIVANSFASHVSTASSGSSGSSSSSDNSTAAASPPATSPCVTFISVEVVLDVGHNPAAMEALSRRIQEQFPGRGVRCVRNILKVTVCCLLLIHYM